MPFSAARRLAPSALIPPYRHTSSAGATARTPRFHNNSTRLTEVFKESAVLLVSPSHLLADRDEIRMEELRKESWIVRAEAHPVVEVLQRSAHEAGFEPAIGFLVND